MTDYIDEIQKYLAFSGEWIKTSNKNIEIEQQYMLSEMRKNKWKELCLLWSIVREWDSEENTEEERNTRKRVKMDLCQFVSSQ